LQRNSGTDHRAGDRSGPHSHPFCFQTPGTALKVYEFPQVGLRTLALQRIPRTEKGVVDGHFWSPSYFLATVGEVKLEDVKRYVQSQAVRNYRFRIYPNREQEQKLLTWLETCRWIYNTALAQRKEAWEKEKRSVSRIEQQSG